MADSIFTKMIKGEVPCHKIYEDDKTLAFLDIFPNNTGHTLVITKKQVEFIWDLEDDDYQALMATVKKIGTRLRQIMGTRYVAVKVVGTDVPHVHIHLIPFDKTEETHRPSDPQRADDAELAQLAKKLAL